MHFDLRHFSIIAAFWLLPLSVALSQAKASEPNLTLTIMKLPETAAAAEKQVHVYGVVKKPGAHAFKPNMTILDAIMVAGGPSGDLIAGNAIRVTSPQRGVTLNYTGISGSFNKEAWTAYFSSVLIAEGDTVYVAERYF